MAGADDALGKILAHAERLLALQIKCDEVKYRSLVESPIEAMLARALCVVFDRFPWRNHKWDLFEEGSPIRLFPQYTIGEYRVDFLFMLKDIIRGTEIQRKLVIECDGHDFHERTKEQAAADRARDRWLQAQDYTVFRFTGSEIWADPLKCAEQVHDWAANAAIWFARKADKIA